MPSRRNPPITRLAFILRRLTRRIWFRAATISLGAILLAVLAALASLIFPFDSGLEMGQDSVGTILQIIASSMLAVTTFSLTAMVTAFGSATQLATPRAAQLLVADTTSQNALSTFLGAFVFAIVGIIGLQTGIYGPQGRLLLFVGTAILIALIVVTLLRWISHLMAFGRMSDVIDRVENAATEAMTTFSDDPYAGARPAVPLPAGAFPVHGETTGYVTHVDVGALKQISAECGLTVHVAALVGGLVHPERPLAWLESAPDDDATALVRDAFTIERHRTFDDDPRLGVIALAEIASRALSPAVNDPGTAIEVLNAMLRVLLLLPSDDVDPQNDRPDDPSRVYMGRPLAGDFLEDAFAPLLREGAGAAEVAIRLLKTLAAIRGHVPDAAPVADRYAASLSDLVAEKATLFESARFTRSKADLWPDPV